MNVLETRLAEALHARADQLDAPDLTPGTPPAVVTPLHRRRPVVAGVAALGLVAAAAVVAVAVSGSDPAGSTRQQDPGIATQSTSAVAPPADPSVDDEITGAEGRFEETDLGYVDPGTPVTTSDGWTAVVSTDSTTLTVTSDQGETWTADLEVARDGSPNRLAGTQLDLGQAGSGWLVRYGDEYARLTVFNLRSDRLVAATVTGGVPFGDGFTEGDAAYRTWLNVNVLRTRVSVGTPDEQRYDVYHWELTGPGEGGGQPDSDVVDLVPVKDGTFCLDGAAGTAIRCAPGTVLQPEDEVAAVEAGTPTTFADGSVGVLVPTGGGFDLRITIDGVPLRTSVPRASQPALDTQMLRIGDALGYLVREESGDSTAFNVFVISGGDLVHATVTGDVPFGNGYTEESARFRTFPAGGGTALYTEVYADAIGDGPPVAVYSWSVDAPQAELRPVVVS